MTGASLGAGDSLLTLFLVVAAIAAADKNGASRCRFFVLSILNQAAGAASFAPVGLILASGRHRV